MKVLALDTSSKICSVAIVEDGKVLKEKHGDGLREHSQTLLPMIDEILKESNLSIKDINLVGCCKGPGSFTGIRVGLATVKAFSDANNIPIVGVNSLEALAYSVILKEGRKDCKIFSMIDARNDNIYFAAYKIRNGNLTTYKNADFMYFTDFIQFIDFHDPVYIVGDANPERLNPILDAEKAKEMAEGKKDIFDYKYTNNLATIAEAVGVAAEYKYSLGIYDNSDTITPMYLKNTQAERIKNGDEEIIHFSKMGITDLEEIKENYDEFPNSWDINVLEEDFKTSDYIVAKQNNSIVGYIGTRTAMNETEIMILVTRKDKRNIGIASGLISYIIRNRDCDKINLEVNGNNTTALNLYKRFGFRQVGLRKKYYNNTDDAVLMSL